jgi:hypothetical protein
MANVFIEPRPKGHSPIENYVVEDQADHVLHTSETQAEAIAWARTRLYPARRAGPGPQRQEEAGPLASALSGSDPPTDGLSACQRSLFP